MHQIRRKTRQTLTTVLILAGAFVAPPMRFIADSRTDLLLKNYSLNLNFVGKDTPEDKSAEWAEGAIVRHTSGYNTSPGGLGLDAIAQPGLKLDGGGGTGGLIGCQPDMKAAP